MSKQAREYAIVDIETTGGSADRSRITEVAIIIHDGQQVIDRWETLVNPQQYIPLSIQGLTGITDEMVADAPIFQDVASTIYDYLHGRIFVAHHVNFDYSFLKHQLGESGLTWQSPKLCTVRLARKIKPGFASYSLGRLCDALGIRLNDRHRAGGDVSATAELFELLVASDSESVLEQMLKRNSSVQRLPANLSQDIFDNLPMVAGVYYFHDRSGKVIYVGKAINIKKRVSGHFTGHNIQAKRQDFLKEIHNISFQLCGTELMALLLECQEINRLWPKYNRALKRAEAKYGLVNYTGMDGYMHVSLIKLAKHQRCIRPFYSLREGVSSLRNLIEHFSLDKRFCHFPSEVSLPTTLEIRARRSIDLPELDGYNERVEKAMEAVQTKSSSYIIVDQGRNLEEKSCIWIENGKFYGMGYISKENQSTTWADYKDDLQRYHGNEYMMQLIESFLQQSKAMHEIIPIEEEHIENRVNTQFVALKMKLM
ncbi:exonuclease domain-containing protein [Sphingobacterium corticis]|uniref:Exonuclease domain-containing protein n=1 Tax=Sphingobacterium corticis TaxID=1812823 RepID=A0ABW5NJP4_9SPHI